MVGLRVTVGRALAPASPLTRVEDRRRVVVVDRRLPSTPGRTAVGLAVVARSRAVRDTDPRRLRRRSLVSGTVARRELPRATSVALRVTEFAVLLRGDSL